MLGCCTVAILWWSRKSAVYSSSPRSPPKTTKPITHTLTPHRSIALSPYHARASQYLLWTAERADVVTLLSENFGNVFLLPTSGSGKGSASIHSLCRSMVSEISSRVVQQRRHAKMVLMRRGAPIQGTVCPRPELEVQPPLFGGLCPVSWCDEKKTVACNDRRLCVELKASSTILGKVRVAASIVTTCDCKCNCG